MLFVTVAWDPIRQWLILRLEREPGRLDSLARPFGEPPRNSEASGMMTVPLVALD
jgi:hypothetical protein